MRFLKAGLRETEDSRSRMTRLYGTASVFSVLGGRPWSVPLKGISRRVMEELCGREDLSFLMLKGVLTMVRL